MGSLGAFFTGDFDEILAVLGHRLRENQRESCLVVIVLANAKTELFQKHLRPCLGEWHYRSAKDVEFVLPGYQGLGDTQKAGFSPVIEDDRTYQDHVFVAATEALEKRSGWRYSGEPSIIVCSAKLPHTSAGASTVAPTATLDLRCCVEIDLARAVRKGLIESVPALFQSIIRFARENPREASPWAFSDDVGVRTATLKLKDGLLKSIAKWLKLEDALPAAELAACFAVRNLA